MTAPLLLAIVVSMIVGVALLAFLLRMGQRQGRARLNAEGFQELEVVVRGRYMPDVIEVWRDLPVRLFFRRDETTPCSEHLIFSDFYVRTNLPAHETTPVCFIPTKCGEFLFTCAYGMYQGRLIVVEPSRHALSRIKASGLPRGRESFRGAATSSTNSLGLVAGQLERGEGNQSKAE